MMTRGGFWLVGAIVALFLVGCGGSGSSSLPKPMVRVINASPDSTALDFLVDDETLGSAIIPLGSSPDFAAVDSGDRDVVILENGTTIQLVAEVQNFEDDRNYLIVALGLKLFGTEDLKRLRALTLQVDRTIPNGNKARLYVVHAYNRKVGFLTPNIDFQTPGDNPLFQIPNMAFGTQTSILVDSGAVTYEARRAGTTSVLASATTTLGAGKIYAVIVGGIEDEAPPKNPTITFIEVAARS